METHSGWDEKAADGPCLIDRLKPYQLLLTRNQKFQAEAEAEAEAKPKPEAKVQSEAES